MKKSTELYCVAGFNFFSMFLNFAALLQNVNAESYFAFLNMLFVFTGALGGMMCATLAGINKRNGN